MDWGNETWVKLYRRDTADWMLLSWRARGLFCLLLRAVNRRGEIDLGRTGPRAVAALVYAGGDVDAVVAALAELTTDGCVTIEGPTLRVRNYVEAQEATASQALRSKMYRERVTKSDVPVTDRDGTVTKSDATVTPPRVPSRRVTNRIEEKRGEQKRREEGGVQRGTGADAPPAPADKRRKREPVPDTIPTAGTPAREVYDAITSDPVLQPITNNPGDFAARIVGGMFPNLSERDIAAQVRRAAAHAASRPAGSYRDGRAYLTNWLTRDDASAATRPKPSLHTPAQPQRTQSLPWARPEPVQSGTDRVMIDGVWYDRATQHDEIEARLAKKFNGGRRNG